MSDARAFINRVYESCTVKEISEQDMEGIVREFSRQGVAQVVPRYFRDFIWGNKDVRKKMLQEMKFPVLVLQGEKDPAQSQWYYDHIESIFPNVKLQVIKDAGHITELEKPEEVNKAILDFLDQ